MALFDEIQNAIKDAMMRKDSTTRDCLRALVSDIKNETVNAGKELTEDVVLRCIQKAVKQHNDSINNFKSGNREDLVKKEQDELSILQKYLPKMLSEEQVQMIILKIIADNKIEEQKRNLGMIMKLLNQHPQKNLIDKKFASQYLNTLLK